MYCNIHSAAEKILNLSLYLEIDNLDTQYMLYEHF